MMEIILASKSPRRRELLKKLVADFSVVETSADEDVSKNNCPSRYVSTVARRKSRVFARKNGQIVIGADTIVYMSGKYYGKPKTEEDAFLMLSELNGKTHSVYTGVCIVSDYGEQVFFDKSNVVFHSLSPNEIRKYVTDFNPLDKAGAYAIQDNVVVKSYSGSYDNIMGLPTEKLKEALTKITGGKI